MGVVYRYSHVCEVGNSCAIVYQRILRRTNRFIKITFILIRESVVTKKSMFPNELERPETTDHAFMMRKDRTR